MISKLERGWDALRSGFMPLIHGCTSLAGKLKYPFSLLRICLESCEVVRNLVPRTALVQVKSKVQHQAGSNEVFCIFWNMGELDLQSSTVQQKYDVNNICNFNFSGSHMNRSFNILFNQIHSECYFNVQPIENIIFEIFCLPSFVLNFQNPVCILHWRHSSIQNGRISSAPWPHVAGGCHIGRCGARISMGHGQGTKDGEGHSCRAWCLSGSSVVIATFNDALECSPTRAF